MRSWKYIGQHKLSAPVLWSSGLQTTPSSRSDCFFMFSAMNRGGGAGFAADKQVCRRVPYCSQFHDTVVSGRFGFFKLVTVRNSWGAFSAVLMLGHEPEMCISAPLFFVGVL
jgi:hypothetical protein